MGVHQLPVLPRFFLPHVLFDGTEFVCFFFPSIRLAQRRQWPHFDKQLFIFSIEPT